jgi:hypothetical protein
MGIEDQTRRVLARFHERTAAFPFQPKEDSAGPGPAQKRDIPKDHPYDPSALKPLSKSLFAASVALGHTLAAYRHFSRLKSTTVSPDGKIGGRGYIMDMTAIRKKLWEASEALSSVSDAIYDEINAPHWKPKLALLDDNDAEDVSRFVDEAKHVLDNPEEEAEEEIEEIEKANDGGKAKKEDEDEDEDEDEEAGGSKLPDGGDAEAQAKVNDQPGVGKQAQLTPRKAMSFHRRHASSYRQAIQNIRTSGLDAQTGGPRVDDRDSAGGPGPFGSFNPDGDATSDSWGYDEGVHYNEYDYPSEWSNDLHQAAQQWAGSALPNDPQTPTEGRDFGLGFGANGEAEEHLGDWSPHSGLPGTPWQSSGDTTPAIDTQLNERHAITSLPGDVADPVARTDYYRGEKGNLVQTTEVAPAETDLSMMDTDYVHEDLNTVWLPKGEPGLTTR